MTRWGAMLAAAGGLAIATAGVAGPVAPGTVEARFDRSISSADETAWLKTLSAEPNQVGSAHDKANAETILGLFRSWGWQAHIETFHALYPTPISTTIEMVVPDHVALGGQEPPLPDDPSTAPAVMAAALPPYLAYQGDGDVTGDLVYVNYGMPDDYRALARRRISVKGKIVIARYGGGWRGLKPKLAAQHGAIGCLIYSDPADDGYAVGDVLPEGGERPPFGIQRGSVADMIVYPGDPLTPGVGATAQAKRLTRETAPVILHIPALPISYGDAAKLLGRLGGPIADKDMRGALPITYHLGGTGAVSVHLAVKSDWSLKPIYDVIAMIPGARFPDQWVIRGNHHDGWVFGASDPLSGHVAMLSEAKALGALLKTGWRPVRTIVYASWDGEEPGLIGSTEWAEQHGPELQRKAVVYINTDNIERGFLMAGGSHDFQQLIGQAAEDVTDPETGASIAARSRAQTRIEAFDHNGHPSPAERAAADKDRGLAIAALGSGSDYSAFLEHLGIPSIDVGFRGEGQSGGVYHSAYDTFHHYTTFDDPGLNYTATLARLVGRLVLRTADADSEPMRFTDFADTVAAYLGEVKKLAADQRTRDEARDRLLGDRSFVLASDPRDPEAPVAARPMTPPIDFVPLDRAVARLGASAAAFDHSYHEKGATLAPAARERLNALLLTIDQTLLDPRGLPGRPWFRNLIYAPGLLTGYGAKTLPGVREAIEDRRFADAALYMQRTADALNAYSDRLDTATKLIGGG